MRMPLALTAVALALVAAACNGSDTATRAAIQEPAASPSSTATRTPPPVVPRKPVAAPTSITAIETLLTKESYYIGAIDGKSGAAYKSAVAAFQKVNGLYGDGVVGPKTLAALKHPVSPTLRKTGAGTRVEVDLTKQVLYVVKNNVITRILPVSSGGGYVYPTSSGGTSHALTPEGDFTIQRRIEGVRVSDLGTLYDPQYYYKGWAIHGEGYVPGYPASHGCIRVPIADGTWLLGQMGVGTKVSIYGGTHVFTPSGH